MQTEKLPSNSHKQFHVILNNNQIKLYTYPDFLKENNLVFTNPDTFWALTIKSFNSKILIKAYKFLKSESTAYFLDDETFNHMHIPFLSITTSASTVIKATNIARFTSSIIHMT